jgi:hypothetical protein
VAQSNDLFQEWRTANRQDFDAEQAILLCSIAFVDGKGDEPTAAQRDKAHRLRAQANDLFAVAMEQMKHSAGTVKRF